MFYVELSCCVCMWHDKRLVASSINLLFALCRGREGRRRAEKISLVPNPKLYWLLPVRLFFLEHLSGWAKFNNCELCAVCFLFYRFVSRNFYDYFGSVRETDGETRLWVGPRLELKLRLWMGGSRRPQRVQLKWGQIVWPETASPFKKARQTSRSRSRNRRPSQAFRFFA